MNAIEFQYRRIRQKYPNAPAIEIWHGVAIDFYLRQGAIPTEVLVRSALARAESYGVKYRPDQLRVPAGNPDGGQWTDEGGGGGRGANIRDRVARNRTPAASKPTANKPAGSTPPAENTPADATSPSQTYRDDFVPGNQQPIDGAEIIPAADRWGYDIDLEKEERGTPTSRRGHAIERHVGKSNEQIIARIFEEKWFNGIRFEYPIIGTFQGLFEANLYVNEALRRQSALVEAVIRGDFGNQPIWVIQEIGLPTGREGMYENGRVTFHTTRAVKVSIQRAKNKNGFRVITAYPSNIRN